MSTVGNQLRAAREAQNLSIQQVAEATKIRTDHVRALEEGRYEVFAAPVYIKGFVRTYAGLVKLPAPGLLAVLETELAGTSHHQDPPLMERNRGALDFVMYQLSKLNWRIVAPAVIAGIVVLIAFWTIRAWSRHKTRDPLADLPPAVYQSTNINHQGELLVIPGRT